MDRMTTPTPSPRFAWGETSAAHLLEGLLGEPVTIEHLCPACGSDRHGRPRVTLASGRRPDISIARARSKPYAGMALTDSAARTSVKAMPAHGFDHGRVRDATGSGSSRAALGVTTLVGVVDSPSLIGVDIQGADDRVPPGWDTVADWVRHEALAKATGEGLRRPAGSPEPDGMVRGTLDLPGFVAAWCILP